MELFSIETIRRMIGLLDWAYRLGVRDAARVDDQGLCNQHIEETRQPGVFGFVTDNYAVGELEWQLRLEKEARLTSMFGAMHRYFISMGRFGSSFLSCFLPIAQDFYNRGLTDWNNAPDGCDFPMFLSRSRVWWTEKGVKPVKPGEYVQEIQLCCFSRMRSEPGYADKVKKRYLLGENRWLTYIRVVGLSLAKK